MSKNRPKPPPAYEMPLHRGDAPALQDPKALLRRFIMAEVLGPPVSKRGQGAQRGKSPTRRREE